MRSKKAVLVGVLGVAVLGSTYVVSTTAQAHDTTRCAHSSTETTTWRIDYTGHEWNGSYHQNYYTHYLKGDPYWHYEVNACAT